MVSSSETLVQSGDPLEKWGRHPKWAELSIDCRAVIVCWRSSSSVCQFWREERFRRSCSGRSVSTTSTAMDSLRGKRCRTSSLLSTISSEEESNLRSTNERQRITQKPSSRWDSSWHVKPISAQVTYIEYEGMAMGSQLMCILLSRLILILRQQRIEFIFYF